MLTRQTISYSMDEWLVFYRQAFDYILELNFKGIDLVEGFARLLLTKILTPFATRFVDLQSPSGAGIAAALYNYDGNVYPMDEARMLAEMGDPTFRIGNVHQDYYQQI